MATTNQTTSSSPQYTNTDVLAKDSGELARLISLSMQTRITDFTQTMHIHRNASTLVAEFDRTIARESGTWSTAAWQTAEALGRLFTSEWSTPVDPGSEARLNALVDGAAPDEDRRSVVQAFVHNEMHALDRSVSNTMREFAPMTSHDRATLRQTVSNLGTYHTWAHRGFVESLHRLRRDPKGLQMLEMIYNDYGAASLDDNLDYIRATQTYTALRRVTNFTLSAGMTLGQAVLINMGMKYVSAALGAGSIPAALPLALMGLGVIFAVTAVGAIHRSWGDLAQEGIIESFYAPDRYQGVPPPSMARAWFNGFTRAAGHPVIGKALLDTSVKAIGGGLLTPVVGGGLVLIESMVGYVPGETIASWVTSSYVCDMARGWVFNQVIGLARTAVFMSFDPYERIRVADSLNSTVNGPTKSREPFLMTKAQTHEFLAAEARRIAETPTRGWSATALKIIIDQWTRALSTTIGAQVSASFRVFMGVVASLINASVSMSRVAVNSFIDVIFSLQLGRRTAHLAQVGLDAYRPWKWTSIRDKLLLMWDLLALVLFPVSGGLQLLHWMDANAGRGVELLGSCFWGTHGMRSFNAIVGTEPSFLKQTFAAVSAVCGGVTRSLLSWVPCIVATLVLLSVVSVAHRAAYGLTDAALLDAMDHYMPTMDLIKQQTAALGLPTTLSDVATVGTFLATNSAHMMLYFAHVVRFLSCSFGGQVAGLALGMITNSVMYPVLTELALMQLRQRLTPVLIRGIQGSFHASVAGFAVGAGVAHYLSHGLALGSDRQLAATYGLIAGVATLGAVHAARLVTRSDRSSSAELDRIADLKTRRDRLSLADRAELRTFEMTKQAPAIAGKIRTIVDAMDRVVGRPMAWAADQAERARQWMIESDTGWVNYLEVRVLGPMHQLHVPLNRPDAYARFMGTMMMDSIQTVASDVLRDPASFMRRTDLTLNQLREQHAGLDRAIADAKQRQAAAETAARAGGGSQIEWNQATLVLDKLVSIKSGLDTQLQAVTDAYSRGRAEQRSEAESDAMAHEALDRINQDMNPGFWYRIGANLVMRMTGIPAQTVQEIEATRAVKSLIVGTMDRIMTHASKTIRAETIELADRAEKTVADTDRVVQALRTSKEAWRAAGQPMLQTMEALEMYTVARSALDASGGHISAVHDDIIGSSDPYMLSRSIMGAVSWGYRDGIDGLRADISLISSLVDRLNHDRSGGTPEINLATMAHDHYYNAETGVLRDGGGMTIRVQQPDGQVAPETVQIDRRVGDLALKIMTGHFSRLAADAVQLKRELTAEASTMLEVVSWSPVGRALVKFVGANEQIRTGIFARNSNDYLFYKRPKNEQTFYNLVENLHVDELGQLIRSYAQKLRLPTEAVEQDESGKTFEPNSAAATKLLAGFDRLFGRDVAPEGRTFTDHLRSAFGSDVRERVLSMTTEQVYEFQATFLLRMQAVRIEAGLHRIASIEEFNMWYHDRVPKFFETLASTATDAASLVGTARTCVADWICGAFSSRPSPMDWMMVAGIKYYRGVTDMKWPLTQRMGSMLYNIGEAMVNAKFVRQTHALSASILSLVGGTAIMGFNTIAAVSADAIGMYISLCKLNIDLVTTVWGFLDWGIVYAYTAFVDTAHTSIMSIVTSTVWAKLAATAEDMAAGFLNVIRRTQIRADAKQQALRASFQEMERAKLAIIQDAVRRQDPDAAELLTRLARMQTDTMVMFARHSTESNMLALLEDTTRAMVDLTTSMSADPAAEPDTDRVHNLRAIVSAMHEMVTVVQARTDLAADIITMYGGGQPDAVNPLPLPGGPIGSNTDTQAYTDATRAELMTVFNEMSKQLDVRAIKTDSRWGRQILQVDTSEITMDLAHAVADTPGYKRVLKMSQNVDRVTADRVVNDFHAWLAGQDRELALGRMLNVLYQTSRHEFYIYVEQTVQSSSTSSIDTRSHLYQQMDAAQAIDGTGIVVPASDRTIDAHYSFLAPYMDPDDPTDRVTQLFANVMSSRPISTAAYLSTTASQLLGLPEFVALAENERIRVIHDRAVQDRADTSSDDTLYRRMSTWGNYALMHTTLVTPAQSAEFKQIRDAHAAGAIRDDEYGAAIARINCPLNVPVFDSDQTFERFWNILTTEAAGTSGNVLSGLPDQYRAFNLNALRRNLGMTADPDTGMFNPLPEEAFKLRLRHLNYMDTQTIGLFASSSASYRNDATTVERIIDQQIALDNRMRWSDALRDNPETVAAFERADRASRDLLGKIASMPAAPFLDVTKSVPYITQQQFDIYHGNTTPIPVPTLTVMDALGKIQTVRTTDTATFLNMVGVKVPESVTCTAVPMVNPLNINRVGMDIKDPTAWIEESQRMGGSGYDQRRAEAQGEDSVLRGTVNGAYGDIKDTIFNTDTARMGVSRFTGAGSFGASITAYAFDGISVVMQYMNIGGPYGYVPAAAAAATARVSGRVIDATGSAANVLIDGYDVLFNPSQRVSFEDKFVDMVGDQVLSVASRDLKAAVEIMAQVDSTATLSKTVYATARQMVDDGPTLDGFDTTRRQMADMRARLTSDEIDMLKMYVTAADAMAAADAAANPLRDVAQVMSLRTTTSYDKSTYLTNKNIERTGMVDVHQFFVPTPESVQLSMAMSVPRLAMFMAGTPHVSHNTDAPPRVAYTLDQRTGDIVMTSAPAVSLDCTSSCTVFKHDPVLQTDARFLRWAAARDDYVTN